MSFVFLNGKIVPEKEAVIPVNDRAVLFGVSQSGPMAALYAATHPHRTEALILYGAYASAATKPDYPFGRSTAWIDEFHMTLDSKWGKGAFLRDVAPSRMDDDGFRRFTSLIIIMLRADMCPRSWQVFATTGTSTAEAIAC